MKSSEIRQAFIDYFVQHGHQAVPSSSLIPANDPTLLFTNAGMVQFKDTFLGIEPRNYSRAVSSQRCLRAGGKHNDLENVGYTARHHTFFEMLGNFSFGDYFKHEAIRYAWRFLTTVLKLPEERLWITVHHDDDEAASIWLDDIGVSAERFSRCGDEDNFWSMGDTGPCGPCTEIFYDHGPDIAGGPPGSPDADGDRYIEIWNLVFMQYNRDAKGQLHPLPKPSVDTGMGLERITAVVQGVHNNYDIDSFQHIIHAIAKLGQLTNLQHPSVKVIADHIRACAFLMTDGVIPSNEGRGYVLRRIIRRAVRHGNKLGLPTPFLARLIPALIEVMGNAYPELAQQMEQIQQNLTHEETQFAHTIDQGLHILQDYIKTLEGKEIAGEIAFKLYDTYGFPVDLTADIAREQGLVVDMAAFEQCMQQQREKSQSASQFKVDYVTPATITETSEFVGYSQQTLRSQIRSILVNGQPVQQLQTGEKAAIILQSTPFYAESGGQVGDRGELLAEGMVFRVEDTQSVGHAILHYGVLTEGALCVDTWVTAQIDNARRQAIRLNHTATHLLHAALKIVVGEHVQQKGSLVDAERARFDYSHRQALTLEQIQQIELLVNDKIRENQPVETKLMSLEAAKHAGAVALFGEKYSEDVRVLSIGGFSKELCGGTHVQRTGDIGLFKIISEYGIASGVRRIEMMTGAYALEWTHDQLQQFSQAANQLKTTPAQLSEKISQWLESSKKQEKELEQLKQKVLAQSGDALLSDVQSVGQVQLLVKELASANGQTLRAMLDQLKSRLDHAVIVLYSIEHNKLSVVAGVSKSLLGQVPSAGSLVRHLCGKGGGRDDMAQGGGPIPEHFKDKLKQIAEMVARSEKPD